MNLNDKAEELLKANNIEPTKEMVNMLFSFREYQIPINTNIINTGIEEYPEICYNYVKDILDNTYTETNAYYPNRTFFQKDDKVYFEYDIKKKKLFISRTLVYDLKNMCDIIKFCHTDFIKMCHDLFVEKYNLNPKYYYESSYMFHRFRATFYDKYYKE